MRVYNVESGREISNQNFEAKIAIKFNRRFRNRFPEIVEEITNILDSRPIVNRFCKLYDVRMRVKLGSNVNYPYCPGNERKQCRILYDVNMINNSQHRNIFDKLKDGYFGIVLGRGKDTLEKAATSLRDSLMDGSSNFYKRIRELIEIAEAKNKPVL